MTSGPEKTRRQTRTALVQLGKAPEPQLRGGGQYGGGNLYKQRRNRAASPFAMTP
ncbi:hypothetical protein FH063_004716 [Azospirillum argentinense]|uniref:Uncharacterized protein n=1 Tax=Azospirillum argentinense TaxID=2970906 RepID=A0A5B0KYX5_9PROT|nr:hypothetical protein FH063_004716 [Azospirillum argentinense]